MEPTNKEGYTSDELWRNYIKAIDTFTPETKNGAEKLLVSLYELYPLMYTSTPSLTVAMEMSSCVKRLTYRVEDLPENIADDLLVDSYHECNKKYTMKTFSILGDKISKFLAVPAVCWMLWYFITL